jgi:hypothetical protein
MMVSQVFEEKNQKVESKNWYTSRFESSSTSRCKFAGRLIKTIKEKTYF